MARLKGEVTWFNEFKGFGFIRDEEGRDVFVHFSEVDREGFQTLNPGEKVEFELQEDEDGLGLKARSVDVVEVRD